MKLKNTTILFLLVIFINAYGQNKDKNILVEYNTTRGTIKNSERLISNMNKAIYITDPLIIRNEHKEIEVDESTNEIQIKQKIIKLDKIKYFLEQENNTIYISQKYKGESILIQDSLPNFNWNLIKGKTKTINEFICKKATLHFRGSDVIAFYTEEIPLSFGPWKFKGLPGLILEIYNINDAVIHHSIVKKITYPYLLPTNFEIPKKVKIVKLKDVILNRDKEMKERMNRMDARAPKGVKSVGSKITRVSIEKIYEWEK